MRDPLRIPSDTGPNGATLIRRQQAEITQLREQLTSSTPNQASLCDSLDRMGATLGETQLRRIVAEQERTIASLQADRRRLTDICEQASQRAA